VGCASHLFSHPTSRNSKIHRIMSPDHTMFRKADQEVPVMLKELQMEVVPTSNPLVIFLVRRRVNHLGLTPRLIQVRRLSSPSSAVASLPARLLRPHRVHRSLPGPCSEGSFLVWYSLTFGICLKVTSLGTQSRPLVNRYLLG